MLDALPIAPVADASAMDGPGHLVQFYDDDGYLLDSVSRFIGTGLTGGIPGVIIATGPHLDGVERRMRGLGVDVATARERGQYVGLDAEETLSRFLIDGWPDRDRFDEVIGGLIDAAPRGLDRRLRAFGEMVALLWARGERTAAVRLEELWGDLIRRQSFSLLCAYPLRGFASSVDATSLLQVCATHSGVIPSESYAGLKTGDERLRMITDLQQKARALEDEIAQRKAVERERTELLAREQAARAQAEAASRAKDEFVATVSHELRTPLTAMLGWVRLLRSGQLEPARVAHALEVVERNTKAQVRLIEDLLDVSRIATGKLHLDIKQVELEVAIRTVLETLRPAAEAKDVTLDARLDASVAPVAGDPDRWQQIVWNLVSNAVKYTPRGGRVEIALARVGPLTRITVKDTGIGIAPDFLPHVFDRFSQASGGTDRSYTGLGLGLSIAQHLVELHGGTIRAESAGEGQGASFIVELPGADLDVEVADAAAPAPGARFPRWR